jgi:hypothetical protein
MEELRSEIILESVIHVVHVVVGRLIQAVMVVL